MCCIFHDAPFVSIVREQTTTILKLQSMIRTSVSQPTHELFLFSPDFYKVVNINMYHIVLQEIMYTLFGAHDKGTRGKQHTYCDNGHTHIQKH